MVYDPLVIISTVLHIMANDPLLFLPSIRRVAPPVANRNPSLSLHFACLWYGYMHISIVLHIMVNDPLVPTIYPPRRTPFTNP